MLARQKALTSEPQNKMQFLNKIHFLSLSSLSCAVLWQFQILFNNFNCQLSNNVTPHFKQCPCITFTCFQNGKPVRYIHITHFKPGFQVHLV